MADKFIDWQVVLTLKVAENSYPAWVVTSVQADLEEGEEVLDYHVSELSTVIDYKKDLLAALQQIQYYSDNDMVIGADGHRYLVSEKLKELTQS